MSVQRITILVPQTAEDEKELANMIRQYIACHGDKTPYVISHQSQGRFVAFGSESRGFFFVQDDADRHRSVHAYQN